jgi:branched-chain amino acid transport system permease protein
VSQFIQVLYGGLTLSGIYMLIATGINVVFGQTRIVNFAHGQFLVVAGLASWEMTSNGVSFPLALIVSVVGVGLAAWVFEFLLLRRVATSPLASFLLTLGVLLILTQATIDRYSTLPHQLQAPIHGFLTLFGARITYASLLVVVLAALTAAVLFVLLRWTRLGRMVRASAEDPLASEHVGIKVRRISSVTFVAGSVLAAWAGCLLSMLYPLGAQSGGGYLIEGFAVALLGGLGSIGGGVVAALLVGVTEQVATGYWKPSWVPALSGVLIIFVLLVRPNGLFGRVPGSTERRESMLPRRVALPGWSRWIAITAFAGAFFVPSMGFSSKVSTLAAFAALYAIVAIGVGYVFRETGTLSFGHGAFWAAGAYWAALATTHWNMNSWIVMLTSAVIGGVLGLLVGFPILRTRGFYFVIITFAVADLAALILTNLVSVTGGGNGMTVLRDPNRFFGISFDSSIAQYRLILVMLGLCAIAVWLMGRSRFGKKLHAMRDNEVLARSLGLNVHGYLVLAFAFSGAIAGLGGSLFLYYNSAITPSLFGGFATVMFPLMVILGGSRIASGPMIGAVVLTFLPFWLNFGPAGTQYAQGAALVLLMIVMPEGFGPGVVRLTRGGIDRVRGRAESPSPSALAPARALGVAASVAGGASVPELPGTSELVR